jgi:hypothetical protein
VEFGSLVVGQGVDDRARAVAGGEVPVGLAVGYRDRDLQRLPGDVGEPGRVEQFFLVRRAPDPWADPLDDLLAEYRKAPGGQVKNLRTRRKGRGPGGLPGEARGAGQDPGLLRASVPGSV